MVVFFPAGFRFLQVFARRFDTQDVWSPLTAEQHAERQGVRRVSSWEQLLGDGTEEEWEGFDEALELWREAPVPSDEDPA